MKTFPKLTTVRRHPDPETRASLIEIVDASKFSYDTDAIEEAVLYNAPAGSERERYATLFAAAPELLEALRKAVTWGETYAREVGIDIEHSTGPLAMDIDHARELIARFDRP